MVIYKITNNINGKCYIGQTIQKLENRFYRHCYEAIQRKTEGALYSAMRKYGVESFSIEVIDWATNITELNYREFIQVHKNNTLSPNGYNLKEGGNNSRLHESTKRKLSDYNKKISKTKAGRENLKRATESSRKTNMKPVIFENSKTGEIIEFESIKATSSMGNHKYINDLLTGRRPYGLYKGYWVYLKEDANFLEKRKNSNKIELNVKIKITNIITNEVFIFDSKRKAHRYVNCGKKTLNKYIDLGKPYKNYLFERVI